MSEICISFRLFLSTILVCCVGYPLIVLVYAQAVFPENSKGSLLTNSQGKLIGSKLIAQEFTELKYFWSRPSAVDYNASGAGGSNLSPTNPRITDRASVLIDRYNLASGEKLTADLVTTS